MVSTFHGLETSKRGLTTSQSALYTTGHNIANANTPGYSRQRVNFETTNPYPGTGLNRPQIPGQIGTGVQAQQIERVRESFLDDQYRTENNKYGYYSSLSSALAKMENVMNEPTDSGLHNVMEQFWSSLQDLANHTENSGAREVVAARGQMLAETLNYYANSIERIKKDLGTEINVKVTDVNKIISDINNLNEQIARVEPSGMLPNDLYDKRDLLVDELSKLVNIKVEKVVPTNYGLASTATAQGVYQIEIVQDDGSSFSPPAMLISADPTSGRTTTSELTIKDTSGNTNSLQTDIAQVLVGNQALSGINFSGELQGLIESYGYVDNGEIKGHYPDMLEKLNNLTNAFVSEFNAIHSQGYSLNGTAPSGIDFFVISDLNNAAKSISVNSDILADSSKIAAGLNSGDSGDNGNAALLAEIKSKDFSQFATPPVDEDGNPMTGNVDNYYAGIIGNLGVIAQSANKNLENSQVLVDSVNYNRQSVSGVSLDEEMTNIITFQHAYNASSRMITVIDEMLDKIINGMGVVGR